MNKKGLLIGCGVAFVLVLVLAVVGGVGYYLWSQKTPGDEHGSITSGVEEKLEAAIANGNLAAAEVPADVAAQSVADGSTLPDVLKKYGWREGDGGFSYPAVMQSSTKNVLDVPASVTTYNWSDIDLCYWPLIGSWALSNESFPINGCYITSVATVEEVTYKAADKGIFSGTLNDGRVFYMKKKVTRGDAVNHVKVLALAYPKNRQEEVEALIDMILKW